MISSRPLELIDSIILNRPQREKAVRAHIQLLAGPPGFDSRAGAEDLPLLLGTRLCAGSRRANPGMNWTKREAVSPLSQTSYSSLFTLEAISVPAAPADFSLGSRRAVFLLTAVHLLPTGGGGRH